MPKVKKEKEESSSKKDKYWCDFCYANGNFPAAYTPNTAYYTEEQQWQTWDSTVEIEETISAPPDWQEKPDQSFIFFEKHDEILKENQNEKPKELPDWLDYYFRAIKKKEPDQLLLLYDKNDDIDVIFGRNQTLPNKNELNGESAKSDWFNQSEHSLVLLHEKGEDLSAWTQNNVWSQQDFDICTLGNHPSATSFSAQMFNVNYN
jgi:hypothetical protein